MAHIMLPKVKSQGFVSPKSGEWNEYDLELLDRLIKSMDVQGVNSQNGNVSSIPDVWAKPLLFEMLLFDEGVNSKVKVETGDGESKQFSKVLRDRVVGEWRCILTMLALCNVKFLDITVEQVEISDADFGMEKVLYDMRPLKTIDYKTPWTSLYVLKYKGTPFAMTSPTTLVSVSADYANVMWGKIDTPWAQDTWTGIMLVDPLPNLSEKDCTMLYAWLMNVRKNLRENANGDSAVLGKLLHCLDEFAKDVRACFSVEEQYNFDENQLEMFKGIFKYLSCPVQAVQVSADDSLVKLRPSEGRNPTATWLLADPDSLARMSTEWDIDKNHILVWSGLTANNINWKMLESDKRDYIGSAKLEGAVWKCADDFFTEHVYYFTQPGVFANAFDPGAQDSGIQDLGSVIPPIRKEVLEYFSLAEIRDRFHLAFDGTNVVASFDLPFVYTDRNGNVKERQRFTISKSYSETDLNHVNFQEQAPLAELWPNAKIENWNKYYFCYIDQRNYKKVETAENSLLFTPWSYKSGSKNSDGEEISCMANKYTVRLNEFPEALICSVLWKAGGYSAQLVDVGLLLVNQPEPIEHMSGNIWSVGIDFGTSNTMLYYKDGNRRPGALIFEPNLYSVIKNNEGVRSAYLMTNFIWPDEKHKNGSFLTIYNVLNKKSDKHDHVEPLIDGHVLSLTADKLEALKGLAKNVVPNLKWATDSNSEAGVERKQKQAEAYIEQICMQIAFEAAKNGAEGLKWHFSYPTAFSSDEYKFFKTMTGRAVASAVAGTPFCNNNKITGYLQESVSNATYFNKMGGAESASFVRGAVCLDIGAGTTDISIITGYRSEPKIVYHASIQYAGRDLFSAIFDWLEYYLSKEENSIGLEDVDDPDRRKAFLDAVMRDKSEEYMEKAADLLVGGSSDDKALMEAVLQIPQIAMTGLFYYVGIILGMLYNWGYFRGEQVPNIYVGGNGSRIFHWLVGCTTDYDKDDIHLRVLKQAMLAGSELPEGEGFDIVLSNSPKMEVAAGMLCDDHNKKWFDEEEIQANLFGENADEIVLNSVLAGEDFETDQEYVEFYNFMNARDIKGGVYISDLPRLYTLVDIYNTRSKDIWGRTVDIDSMRREICDRTTGYYTNERSKSVESIRVEPVFITAMKALIGQMRKQLKNRMES